MADADAPPPVPESATTDADAPPPVPEGSATDLPPAPPAAPREAAPPAPPEPAPAAALAETPADDDERAALAELEAALGATTDPPADASTLLRFLRARQRDVAKAKAFYLEDVAWRAQWRPSEVAQADVPAALPSGTWRSLGLTEDARAAVLWIRVELWNPGDYDVDESVGRDASARARSRDVLSRRVLTPSSFPPAALSRAQVHALRHLLRRARAAHRAAARRRVRHGGLAHGLLAPPREGRRARCRGRRG